MHSMHGAFTVARRNKACHWANVSPSPKARLDVSRTCSDAKFPSRCRYALERRSRFITIAHKHLRLGAGIRANDDNNISLPMGEIDGSHMRTISSHLGELRQCAVPAVNSHPCKPYNHRPCVLSQESSVEWRGVKLVTRICRCRQKGDNGPWQSRNQRQSDDHTLPPALAPQRRLLFDNSGRPVWDIPSLPEGDSLAAAFFSIPSLDTLEKIVSHPR